MKKIQVSVDQFLPFGELMRGFANQVSLSKGDLKRTLRSRGIFLSSSEKEQMVPLISTLLLSPKEYDELRECQNTREDTLKKSSSRIAWSSKEDLVEAIPKYFPLEDLNISEYSSYKLKYPPQVALIDGNRNKIKVDFEIERFDLNKSWYESHNEFSGSLYFEMIGEQQLQIIRTFTSSETDELGNKIQNFVVRKCKERRFIEENQELEKILFSSFENETRIVFFFRLSTNIENDIFTFDDLVDIHFKPDESIPLPAEIDWMNMKDQLILKGKQLHNTFFIKEKRYHKYLQFWGFEAKYKFQYLGLAGSLIVSFEYANFLKAGNNAEFEIKINSIGFSKDIDSREREKKKQQLLESLEKQKNKIYKDYMNYLRGTNDKP